MTRAHRVLAGFLVWFGVAVLAGAAHAEYPANATAPLLTPYDDSISGNYYWVAGGAGFDTLGSAHPFTFGSAEISMMRNDHFFSLRASAAGTRELLVRPRPMTTFAHSVDLLYGRGAHTDSNRKYFGSAILSLSMGLGWVHVDFPRHAKSRDTVGVPLQLENIYMPIAGVLVGLGVTAAFNVNPVKPWGSLALNVVLGKLD